MMPNSLYLSHSFCVELLRPSHLACSLQSFSVIVTLFGSKRFVTIIDDFTVQNCHFGPLRLTKTCHNKQFVPISVATITRLGNRSARVSDFSLQKLRFSALCGPN